MKKRKPAKRGASKRVKWGHASSRWPRPTTWRLAHYGNPASLKTAQDANEAINRAEYFQDYSLIIDRLRKGLTSMEEMQVAADLIDGKHQPEKRSRGGQLKASFDRSLRIAAYVGLKIKGGEIQKNAVLDAKKEFGLSEPRIYAALKDVKEATGVADISLLEISGPEDADD
jgi:hypothetical protein